MRIALFGAQGQVGWELQRSLASLGQVMAWQRSSVDLSSPADVQRLLEDSQADLVVNAAAYTAVDRAESEPQLAIAVNAESVAVMAQHCARRHIPLVHYSTDYVFDGTATEPYTEQSPCCPINAYGESKRQGEIAIAASGCSHLTLRTSWVYAARGQNFLRTMLRLGAERPELRVVADQIGAPTWARTIADTTVAVLQRAVERARQQQRTLNEVLAENGGIFHLTAAGQTSWHHYAETIFAAQSDQRAACVVHPIPSSAYPTPAPRPAYSVLDGSRLRQVWGVHQIDWQTALQLCLEEIRSAG